MINLIFWVGLCLLSGFAGSSATLPEITGWYQQIQKPSWTPPDWIFGPVWTLLYILMGIAASRVWAKRKESSVFYPLALFLLQLALNTAWSFIFFGQHLLFWALIEILILLSAIALTWMSFRKIDSLAGYLFIPYLIWVIFATYLNAAIWWLNR